MGLKKVGNLKIKHFPGGILKEHIPGLESLDFKVLSTKKIELPLKKTVLILSHYHVG